MSDLIEILDGVVGGFVATGLTVSAVRLLLPPRIKISTQIATASPVEHGASQSRIKLMNNSYRAIVDLKFEFTILYERGGRKLIRPVPTRPEPMLIPGRRLIRGQKEHSGTGIYTITHGKNLLDILEDRKGKGGGKCTLRLRVFGRDAVSGFGRQFEVNYDYPCKENFVYGNFKHGRSLVVEKPEKDKSGPEETKETQADAPDARQAGDLRGDAEDPES
jgi:hypothetical protein